MLRCSDPRLSLSLLHRKPQCSGRGQKMNRAFQVISETFALLGAAASAAAAVEARRTPSAAVLNRLGISEAAFRNVHV